MKQPTTEQRLEHIEENTRRVIGAISSLAIDSDPNSIREMIDRHRATLDRLRSQIANATTFSPTTRASLDRLDSILEHVTAELDDARARVDAWHFGPDSPAIVAGIVKDAHLIVAVAIASIVAHLANK